MVYLTSCIHKFNGVMRKEVALKEESSRWVCWALAAFAAFQAAGTVLLLYQQQLWTNFYLMPGGVDGVSFTLCPFGLPMWTQNRLINRLDVMTQMPLCSCGPVCSKWRLWMRSYAFWASLSRAWSLCCTQHSQKRTIVDAHRLFLTLQL